VRSTGPGTEDGPGLALDDQITANDQEHSTASCRVAGSGNSFDKITEALNKHGSTIKGTGTYKAMAQCPAHDDRNPSLSLTWTGGDNPLTLMYCFAGCDNQDIMAAIGLRMADLYDKPGTVTYAYTNASGSWADRFVLRDPETARRSGKKPTRRRYTAATCSPGHEPKGYPFTWSKARKMPTPSSTKGRSPPPRPWVQPTSTNVP